MGDRQRISQVLVNLLTNACDASKPGDRIEIIAFQDEEYIQLELMDRARYSGAGSGCDIRTFFTTKNRERNRPQALHGS